MLASMATSFYTDIYQPARGLRIYKDADKKSMYNLKILLEDGNNKR